MPNPLMTDGPWRYGALWGCPGRCAIISPSYRVIAWMAPPDYSRGVNNGRARAATDARALAAAPTLIAALEAIAAMDAGGGMSLGDQVFVVTSARAALRALSEG